MPSWSSSYPISLDNFTGTPQVDGVDTVYSNHPNTLATALEAMQSKMGITGGVHTGCGGFSFDSAGRASFPGASGDPTLWVDNSGGSDFPLVYTDDQGVDWYLNDNLNIGYEYNIADVSIAVGDLVSIDSTGSDDDVIRADANAPSPTQMHGLVATIYGGGTLCDIIYGGEVTNAAWTGLFTIGTPVYLGTKGTNNGLASSPPGGSGSLQQEVGFFRNDTTLVLRPTLVTVI
jgi:hypothetical protein